MVKSEIYLKKFELSRYIYLVKILFSRFNILLVCIYTQYKHVCMKKNYQSTFFPTFPISMNSSFLNMMEYFYVFLSSRKKLRRHFVTKTYSKLRFYPPKKWVYLKELRRIFKCTTAQTRLKCGKVWLCAPNTALECALIKYLV